MLDQKQIIFVKLSIIFKCDFYYLLNDKIQAVLFAFCVCDICASVIS